MPLSTNISTREFDKFELDAADETAVRVLVKNDASDPVPVIFNEGTAVVKNYFSEDITILQNVETEIVAYTVPVGFAAKLIRTEFGGQHLALFSIFKNGVKIGMRRTWWTKFSDEMVFHSGSANGYPLVAGDVISLKALHTQSTTGDFEGRILVLEDAI